MVGEGVTANKNRQGEGLRQGLEHEQTRNTITSQREDVKWSQRWYRREHKIRSRNDLKKELHVRSSFFNGSKR